MECTESEPERLCKVEVSSSDDVNPSSKGSNETAIDMIITKEENCVSSEAVNVPRSKKDLKRERKLEKRLKMKTEWKLQRKIKSKERRKKQKQMAPTSNERKPKITEMAQSESKFHVVIDFSYDELMSVKDLTKCGNQVVRCYSANRRSSNPLQLYFCNFSGKIREEMGKCYEFGKWDIHFHENTYLDVFSKEELVYLTSESRNVLETLDENKVYIIGGLVDHNAHKGVSYRKAVLEGIAHAQLPIRKNIQMKTRSVLTINHVFEIMLKVSNGEPWSKALHNVIPPRFFETINPVLKEVDKSEEARSSNDDVDGKESDSDNYCPKIENTTQKIEGESERLCDISSTGADKT